MCKQNQASSKKNPIYLVAIIQVNQLRGCKGSCKLRAQPPRPAPTVCARITHSNCKTKLANLFAHTLQESPLAVGNTYQPPADAHAYSRRTANACKWRSNKKAKTAMRLPILILIRSWFVHALAFVAVTAAGDSPYFLFFHELRPQLPAWHTARTIRFSVSSTAAREPKVG